MVHILDNADDGVSMLETLSWTHRSGSCFTAKTRRPPQVASGYFPGQCCSGGSALTESTPQPVCTNVRASHLEAHRRSNDAGFVGNSHSTVPVAASYARNRRSFEPPLTPTSPLLSRESAQFCELFETDGSRPSALYRHSA